MAVPTANEGLGIDIEMRFNRVFGCGYPSDPLTKKWLKDVFDPVFGFPTVVRFSWSTARKMLQESAGSSNKDAANWFDLADEEKKNKASGKESKHQQMKLQVQVKPALKTRKI